MLNIINKLICISGAIGLLVATPAALAQDAAANYPNRTIRYIVGYTPGGTSDMLARAVGQKLAAAWGQQVIVDNRPGANANLAAEIAAKASPDGYTVMMISVSHAISKPLYKKLGYDLVRDFTPLINISSVPMLVVVPPSSTPKTVADVIVRATR